MTIEGGGRRWATVAALAAVLVTRVLAQTLPGTPIGGPEFVVNTTTDYSQERPSVAVAPSGDFVVVWSSYGGDSGYGNSIVAQRFASSGARLGGEFQVNGSSYAYEPEVAADGGGNFVVVWSGGDSYGGAIFGRRVDGSGNLGAEFQVSEEEYGSQEEPDVAASGLGNFVVVWESSTEGGTDIFARRFNPNGPLGGEFQVNSATYGYGYGRGRPRVSTDSSGSFVVVWEDRSYGDGQGAIIGQRFNALGSRFGEEFIQSGAQNEPRRPDVAGGPFAFVVTWEEVGGEAEPSSVFFRRFSLLGPAGPTAFHASLSGAPRVTRDAAGNFVIVSVGSIAGQRYSPLGAPLGSGFVVTASDAYSPISIDARDSTGDFVVTWSQYNGEGNATDVLARQFAVPPSPTSSPTATGTATSTPSPTPTISGPTPTVAPNATPTALGGASPTPIRTSPTPTPGTPTVEVTAPGNTTASPGQLVEAGRFRIRNASNAPIFINCTIVDFETPGLFVSAIMHGATGQFEGLDKAVPGRPSEFCFEPPLRVEPGAAADFDLRVGIADRGVARAPSAILYAGVLPTGLPFAVEWALLLWLVAVTAPTKRAAAARVALALVVLAIALLGGCGDDDDAAAVRGVSTQRLTAIRATGQIGEVNFTGLPVTLGTLEVR